MNRIVQVGTKKVEPTTPTVTKPVEPSTPEQAPDPGSESTQPETEVVSNIDNI